MSRKKPSHREQAPGGSQRQLRVGELVRHAVADMLTRGEVHDPVIEKHMITIPEVRVTADLRLATVYVMPLGGRDADEVVAAFERHKKFLRAEIAHRINLKFAPDIRFRVDDRFACQCVSGRLPDVVDRAKGNGNYDQLRRARRTADGCAVVSNGAYVMTSTLEPASERATHISVSNDSDFHDVVS